jgi:hypothetical protein
MKVAQAVFVLVVLIPGVLLCYPGGIANVTMKMTTSGCSCHNGTPTTSVIVGITGPATLNPGKTGSYTVTVTDAAGSNGGVDIAASSGTLAPVSTYLKTNSGDLTHNKAVTVPSTYNFTYTAPATPGPVTLYATAKGSAFSAWNNAPNFSITVASATLVAAETNTPASFQLEQNYPNPFNPATKIRFSIPAEAFTSVKIYDLQGREVAALVNGTLKPGTYDAEWNAGRLASGVYLYRMTAGTYTETKKLLLQK